MRRRVKFLLIVGLLLTSTSYYQAVTAEAPEEKVNTQISYDNIFSEIDGINVPFEVLDYAQMEYQGYAVTEVRRLFTDGKQMYQLKVDNNDISSDSGSMLLLYDQNWKLISSNKFIPAPTHKYKVKEEVNVELQINEQPVENSPESSNTPVAPVDSNPELPEEDDSEEQVPNEEPEEQPRRRNNRD